MYTADGRKTGPGAETGGGGDGGVLALNIILIKHYIKLNHFFVYRAHCQHRPERLGLASVWKIIIKLERTIRNMDIWSHKQAESLLRRLRW